MDVRTICGFAARSSVVPQPQPRHRPRPEALHHDIGRRHQPQECLPPRVACQVESDPALVHVEMEEREAAVRAGQAADEWWAVTHEVTDARPLDFDDVRAVGRQQPRAVRTGRRLGEVEDGQPFEWPRRSHYDRSSLARAAMPVESQYPPSSMMCSPVM
jgi:hypothetical protein